MGRNKNMKKLEQGTHFQTWLLEDDPRGKFMFRYVDYGEGRDDVETILYGDDLNALKLQFDPNWPIAPEVPQDIPPESSESVE